MVLGSKRHELGSSLGKLNLVCVSLNDGKVLWLVLFGDWHEAGLCKLKLIGISLNNGEVLWLVLLGNWHELSLSKSKWLLTVPVVSSSSDSKTSIWVNKWISKSNSKKSG